MNRIAPSVSPRLEFFVTDSTGAAVASLDDTDVTSAHYVLITAGVRAAAVEVVLTGSVASTAAISAGQFVTISSAKGHYAVDCAAGAALSTADSVELVVVMDDGTQLVYPVSHAIDVAVSSRASQTSVDDVPTNAELATALGTADDATLAAIAALNNLSAAQVNAEVLDVLQTDTFAELGAVPAATSSLKDKLTWLFMWARNKATETATQRKLYADDGTTVVSTETVSDDATTFTKGEQV